MRDKPMAVTELPESPDRELHSRMIKYGIAMGIRVVCVILVLFVRGWWLVLPIAGAVLLPYIAVVIANAAAPRGVRAVERPGAVVRVDHREPV